MPKILNKTERNINVTNHGCSVLLNKLISGNGRYGDGQMKVIKGHRVYMEDEFGQYKNDPRMIFAKNVVLKYLPELDEGWEIEVSIRPCRIG